ncbi:hypothetical protein ACNPNU_05190 [Pseudomonas shirazica]|uniref:hypothetical protein n=1 Tax=Pseudomonas putida group TaxID=136845 RepID=UPI0015FC35DC|nr:hypothetical protein [Pseudomonas monteilii]MBA6105693.1 hypothetical protein [Pseudomonas monteilii]
MSKPDNQVNELHLRDPKPGDFWHERFCPYHIVLAVTPAGVVIADKTKPDGDSHYTFDLESAREITHEEHAKAVRYSSGSGFAADVVPVRAALSAREWKAAGSKYIAVAEQKAAPHAGEALMDTNKMRDTYEAWAIQDAASVGRDLVIDREGDWYIGKDAQFLNLGWASWQASRAAVVVELPSAIESPPYACFQSGWNDMRGEAVDAIEAQGLKVAP